MSETERLKPGSYLNQDGEARVLGVKSHSVTRYRSRYNDYPDRVPCPCCGSPAVAFAALQVFRMAHPSPDTDTATAP